MNTSEFKKYVNRIFLIGHGKNYENNVLECGLKDLCDVLKNIFAIGTLLVSCITIVFIPIPMLKDLELDYGVWVGGIGLIFLSVLLIMLLIQLFVVISKTSLVQFGNSTIGSRTIALVVFIIMSVGILFGLVSLTIVAIMAISK